MAGVKVFTVGGESVSHLTVSILHTVCSIVPTYN
jgi:hypothetical protein